ncbi:MAG: glycosyltransferase family 2 protein [Patescibacteria group bacterium]|jgi:glycosyltransferase involved in cell wall biosynthesis
MTQSINNNAFKTHFIVIPAYNEARNIGTVLDSLLTEYHNIIVVDDCSKDDTCIIVSRYPVHLLRHITNLGQGAALQTGTEYAVQQGASIITHFDSDGQHRLQDIKDIINPLLKNETDVVFGSRFLNKSSNIPNFKRRVILPIGKLVNWAFTGLWLSDAHNGFRALNNNAAIKIQLKQNRMAHATEILSQVKKHHLRYTEVPVVIEYHNFGQTFSGGIKIVRDLILKNIFK